MSNQSLEWYNELINPMGRTGLSRPWSTYQRQLRNLAADFPTMDCELAIGLRGFQAAVSQQANMEKRLLEAPLGSREFRRIFGWRWNWKRVSPELTSFGWSHFDKVKTI